MANLRAMIRNLHRKDGYMKLSWLRMGVKSRLLATLCLVGLTTAGAVVRVLSTVEVLRTSKGEQHQLVDALSSLKDMEQAFAEANLLGMDIIVDHYEAPGKKVERRGEFGAFKAGIEKRRGLVVDSVSRVHDSVDAEETIASLMTMLSGVEKLMDAIDRGEKRQEVYAGFDSEIDGAKEKGFARIAAVRSDVDEKFKKSQAKMDELFDTVVRAVVWSLIATLLVVLLLATPIAISISRSLAKLQERLGQVSTSLDKGSETLATSSQKLAELSAQSAAAVQESVSSITEMNAMLSQTSRNAREAADLSRDGMEQSQDAVGVMGEMSASMKSISSASTRLSEIEKVIENIAAKTNVINDVVFKTQLLAVNASIEAARAGHHGKGFAVVANEVASLAALSGKASSEIKELLVSSASHVKGVVTDTASSVREGEKSCGKASEAFEAISKSLATICDKVEQISVATKEQEGGVAQTSAALSQMNQASTSTNTLAQGNAKLGSEIAQSASNLKLVDRGMTYLVSGGDPTTGSMRAGRNRKSPVDEILTGSDRNRDTHKDGLVRSVVGQADVPTKAPTEKDQSSELRKSA